MASVELSIVRRVFESGRKTSNCDFDTSTPTNNANDSDSFFITSHPNEFELAGAAPATVRV
jgi:hypothetical protein